MHKKATIITSIHRSNTYNGEARGIGCYIQACEERLMNADKYALFIDNMIQPLINSNVQTILICIDPLVDDSSRERLTDIAKRLTSMDRRIIMIVPMVHVNAAVGRNLIFNCIRRMENDERNTYRGFVKHLLWYGADDDDRIVTTGINDIQQLITEERFPISTILMVHPDLDTEWKMAKGSSPTYHYAQWCYLMSPVYYNGLSYPITPLEKEDLDVFNRLHQHHHFIVAVDKYNRIRSTSITMPYIYNGTNPTRARADRLYNTVDVIDYLNAHHMAETKDTKLNAPSATAHKRGYKAYYMNDAERYYLYDSNLSNTHRLEYGIAIHNNSNGIDSHTDIYDAQSIPTLIRLIENVKDPKLKELLHKENFNGDLYMFRYEMYVNDGILYGISFQNGKDPFDIISDVDTGLTRLVKKCFIAAKTIGDELLKAFNGNPLVFTKQPSPQADEVMNAWNESVLSERSPGRHIPLRTFGGKETPEIHQPHERAAFYSLLLISVAILSSMLIIIYTCSTLCGTRSTSDKTTPTACILY